MISPISRTDPPLFRRMEPEENQALGPDCPYSETGNRFLFPSVSFVILSLWKNPPRRGDGRFQAALGISLLLHGIILLLLSRTSPETPFGLRDEGPVIFDLEVVPDEKPAPENFPHAKTEARETGKKEKKRSRSPKAARRAAAPADGRPPISLRMRTEEVPAGETDLDLSKEGEESPPIPLSKLMLRDDYILDMPLPTAEELQAAAWVAEAAPFVRHVMDHAGNGGGSGSLAGKVADVIFVIDTSGSMNAVAGLLRQTLSVIFRELLKKGAEEVRFGVVVFRENPEMRHPLYSGDPEYYPGIEVLEYPGSVTEERIRRIESRLKLLEFHGEQEPVGLAVKQAIDLLKLMPSTPLGFSRQIVVITDQEGMFTKCGDRSYPEEMRYPAMLREARWEQIVVSHFLLETGTVCGCIPTEDCQKG